MEKNYSKELLDRQRTHQELFTLASFLGGIAAYSALDTFFDKNDNYRILKIYGYPIGVSSIMWFVLQVARFGSIELACAGGLWGGLFTAAGVLCCDAGNYFAQKFSGR